MTKTRLFGILFLTKYKSDDEERSGNVSFREPGTVGARQMAAKDHVPSELMA